MSIPIEEWKDICATIHFMTPEIKPIPPSAEKKMSANPTYFGILTKRLILPDGRVARVVGGLNLNNDSITNCKLKIAFKFPVTSSPNLTKSSSLVPYENELIYVVNFSMDTDRISFQTLIGTIEKDENGKNKFRLRNISNN